MSSTNVINLSLSPGALFHLHFAAEFSGLSIISESILIETFFGDQRKSDVSGNCIDVPGIRVFFVKGAQVRTQEFLLPFGFNNALDGEERHYFGPSVFDENKKLFVFSVFTGKYPAQISCFICAFSLAGIDQPGFKPVWFQGIPGTVVEGKTQSLSWWQRLVKSGLSFSQLEFQTIHELEFVPLTEPKQLKMPICHDAVLMLFDSKLHKVVATKGIIASGWGNGSHPFIDKFAKRAAIEKKICISALNRDPDGSWITDKCYSFEGPPHFRIRDKFFVRVEHNGSLHSGLVFPETSIELKTVLWILEPGKDYRQVSDFLIYGCLRNETQELYKYFVAFLKAPPEQTLPTL